MKFYKTFVILLCLLFTIPCWAEINGLSLQRIEYLQAKQALQSGNYPKYLLLSQILKNYPLYPYLRYEELTRNLDRAPEKAVQSFLTQYQDTPLSNRLRMAWLESLAKQQNWRMFLRNYQPLDTSLQCERLQALIAIKPSSEVWNDVQSQWLKPQVQPVACQPVFQSWRTSGKLSDDLIWQRIKIDVENNYSDELKTLVTWLPADDQNYMKEWQTIRSNPDKLTTTELFQEKNDPVLRSLWVDALTDYAKHNSTQAAEQWADWQKQFGLDTSEKQAILRTFALSLAHDGDPSAQLWLSQIKPMFADQQVKCWRVRTALLNENWNLVQRGINDLSNEDRKKSEWRYWQARAYQALGQPAMARSIYQNLSESLGYYGLLSAKQLNQLYRPASSNYAIAPSLLQSVGNLPGIQRARELYFLKFNVDARREWQWATRNLSKPQLLAAAELAQEWGWTDRMITTAQQSGENHNLQLSFPLAYRDIVLKSAQDENLDPAWVFAIIHQESGFMYDIKSDAGAFGLMQLMPNTARILSPRMASNFQLLNPAINIDLGTRYLKQLLMTYRNQRILATAAYNVGPTRLKKWIVPYAKLPADIWIEVLPWHETREYVENVLLATAIYQQEL